MIRIKEAIIVEGKYDKIRLSSVVDGLVVPVGGFHIYKNRELQNLIRTLAQSRGIIILTDSDAAGFRIRNFIKNIAASGRVYHAYIPDLYGKERRKTAPSAEGKLGVEGVPDSVVLQALQSCGISVTQECKKEKDVFTTADLYEAGLTGTQDSRGRRIEFLHRLGLPEHLSNHMLLQCLSGLITKEEFYRLIEEQKGGESHEKIRQSDPVCRNSLLVGLGSDDRADGT